MQNADRCCILGLNFRLLSGEVYHVTDTNETFEREQRLRRWIEEYRTMLLKTCILYLADFSQAEDAVQETFLKAWKSMDQFEGRNGSSERTWLVSIAINTCKDYMRSRWFRNVDTAQALEELPDRLASVPPEDRDLFIDITKLPVKYKSVIILYYYQGMTQQEIAGILKVSRTLVSRRLTKTLEMLRISLGEEERA